MKHLFVYGTLRRDIGLFGIRTMDKEGEVVGLGYIYGKMYNIGWYPGVIPDDNLLVRGQLVSFESSNDLEWQKQLGKFDQIEGVGVGLYSRVKTEVTMDDGTVTDAFVYYYQRTGTFDEENFIPSGDWKADGRVGAF